MHIGFLRTELGLALRFAEIALTCNHEGRAARSRKFAQRGYETVLRLYRRDDGYGAEERQDIEGKLQELSERLALQNPVRESAMGQAVGSEFTEGR